LMLQIIIDLSAFDLVNLKTAMKEIYF
jgi:hypothetical protein